MHQQGLSLRVSSAESSGRRPARDCTRHASCSSGRGPSPPRYATQRSLSSSGSLTSLVLAVETASRSRVRFGDASSASHIGGGSFNGGRRRGVDSFLHSPAPTQEEGGGESFRRRHRSSSRQRSGLEEAQQQQQQREAAEGASDGWRERGHILPVTGLRQSFTVSADGDASSFAPSASWSRAVNRRLSRASSLEETLALSEQLHTHFDAINVATALCALARTAGGASRRARLDAPQAARVEAALQQLSVLVVSGAVQYEPRTLASCAHSLAKLRCRVPEVWVALGRNATRRAAELGPQDIANLLWAFASIRYRARPLFRALAAAAALQPDGAFKPQELSIVAWSLASMSHSEPGLFERLAPEAVRLAPRMSPQNLSNTLWAYAKAGHRDPRLFVALGRQAAARSGALSSQNIANVLWALATTASSSAVAAVGSTADEAAADQEEEEEEETRAVVAVLAEEVWARGTDFRAQELSASAWALARLSHRSPAAFHCFSQAAKARARELTPQGLATVMWSFASARHDAPHLFRALMAEFSSRGPGCKASPLDLAMMAWAHATLSYSTSAAEGLAQRILPRATELGGRELSNAVWALAVLGLLEAADLEALGPVLEARAAELGPEALTQLLQADLAVVLASGGLSRSSSSSSSSLSTQHELLPPSTLPSALSTRARALRLEELKEEREAPLSSFQAAVLQVLEDDVMMRPMGGAAVQLREPALGGLLQATLSVTAPGASAAAGGPARRIAVEAEGPSRFTATEPRRPLGSTLLRRRLLRLAGWEVVSVPYFEWERLCGDKAKAAYLQKRLVSPSGNVKINEEYDDIFL